MNERDKKVIIKIVSVENSHIQFRCIHEYSDYHIDDMPTYNFDLTNFADIDDRGELLKRIAQSAISVATSQEINENLGRRAVSKLKMRELINEEISMTVGEAYSGNNHKVSPHNHCRKRPWYKRFFR